MDERRIVASGPAERLDRWLRRVLPNLSRRVIVALIEDGSVRLDGRRARKGSTVRPGATVDLPADVALTPNPEISLVVLHEDADVIAIDKPGGLPSHPLDPRERDTVVNALLARHAELACLGGGLAHRLDTGTSGVLVAARSAAAWTELRAAFARRAVEKRYLAVVAGRAPAQAEVDLALAHAPRDRGRMVPATPGRHSWPARTSLRLVRTDGTVSLVHLVMRTGVTHQLRAHLAHLGHPVLGDRRYGGPAAGLAPGRHALHAAALLLPAWGTRTAVAIESPLPADLARLMPGDR